MPVFQMAELHALFSQSQGKIVLMLKQVLKINWLNSQSLSSSGDSGMSTQGDFVSSDILTFM